MFAMEMQCEEYCLLGRDAACFFARLKYFLILKMEAVRFSETSVNLYRTTRRLMQEDSNFILPVVVTSNQTRMWEPNFITWISLMLRLASK
jgi:hypothetical protein